jgi:hypothetical protein
MLLVMFVLGFVVKVVFHNHLGSREFIFFPFVTFLNIVFTVLSILLIYKTKDNVLKWFKMVVMLGLMLFYIVL